MKSWNIPNEGQEGVIENQKTGQVLSLPSDANRVKLSDKTQCGHETWSRSTADVNGWFKLTNLETKKVLTAPRTTLLTNTGM